MPKTPKKIYAASSNPTSSCRLSKSVGDFAHCKNLFGKANVRCPLEEKRFTVVPFRGRNHCCLYERRLENFIAFKTLILERQRSLNELRGVSRSHSAHFDR